uniref:Alpha-1,3-glucosyltransferase n=1 Tax=Petromyzon marinus TaxID=7757 RepID=S4RXN8_PETMA
MRRCTCAALAVLLAIVVRWCVALNGYSGDGKPPMFGDYEAQRHWQEITLNLPIREWYFNSTRNDLLYWGLDYPPLTAYHSLLCGYVARWFDRRWVELGESRGHEGMEHKMFMRATVMLADVLVFIPAVVLCCLWGARDSWRRKKAFPIIVSTLSTLLYPGIILIDHGHFQYNGVSLGLSLWASLALLHGRPLLASVAFCLSLTYKQMQLYHAPAFFCFLLARCIHSRPRTRGLLLLLRLAITVIATLAVCFAPFLSDPQQLLQILARIFPVSRGLYEDKVANVWCSLSVVFKIRNILSQEAQLLVSLLSTLLSLSPSCFLLLRSPSLLGFKLCLVISSLSFFLFSFQVHEKSILLAAICLLLSEFPLAVTWFLVVSTFSMLPLLQRDGLLLPTVTMTLGFIVASWGLLTPRRTRGSRAVPVCNCVHVSTQVLYLLCALLSAPHQLVASLVSMVTLLAGSCLVSAPARYPDLFPVLISATSCFHFLVFLAIFTAQHVRAVGTRGDTQKRVG